jgi:hypothetical protein
VHVKEPESGERRIDYPGIATLSIGLVSLLVALDQVADWGWGDPRVIGMLVLAVVMVGSFGRLELDGIEAAFRLDAALSVVGLLVAIAFVGGRPLPASRRARPAS